MKCINPIEDLLSLSSSLYRSARRNMFLVCSVASVIKESINMAKKENIWIMISHWLPLTTPPIWGHLNVHVSSTNLVCNVATNFVFHPDSFSLLKSHRYPEQHDNNNNALFTGQYIVTVQLGLTVVLQYGHVSIVFIHLTIVNLWGQQICKSALPWKQSITTVPINCSPIQISLAVFQ